MDKEALITEAAVELGRVSHLHAVGSATGQGDWDGALFFVAQGVEVDVLVVPDLQTDADVQRVLEQRIPPVLIAECISPVAAQALRLQRVGYVDAAGNAHIEMPSLYIHVEGRPRQQKTVVSPTDRAFREAGLKLTFCVLVDPSVLDGTFRDLADLAGVSRGAVGYVLNDLVEVGILGKTGSGRGATFQLLDRERLLDQWVEAYARVLRPKLIAERLRLLDVDEREHLIQRGKEVGRWSGDVAEHEVIGWLLPSALRSYSLVFYSSANIGDVRRALRAIPDSGGTVEVLRPFWTQAFEDTHPPQEGNGVVWPVLIYADLMASGDPRAIEVAVHVRRVAIR